jgi:hypothetical protein
MTQDVSTGGDDFQDQRHDSIMERSFWMKVLFLGIFFALVSTALLSRLCSDHPWFRP